MTTAQVRDASELNSGLGVCPTRTSGNLINAGTSCGLVLRLACGGSDFSNSKKRFQFTRRSGVTGQIPTNPGKIGTPRRPALTS
jgi:hypothetical protein